MILVTIPVKNLEALLKVVSDKSDRVYATMIKFVCYKAVGVSADAKNLLEVPCLYGSEELCYVSAITAKKAIALAKLNGNSDVTFEEGDYLPDVSYPDPIKAYPNDPTLVALYNIDEMLLALTMLKASEQYKKGVTGVGLYRDGRATNPWDRPIMLQVFRQGQSVAAKALVVPTR
jgi:hypothetical protein